MNRSAVLFPDLKSYQFSKKDQSVRPAELRDAILPEMLKAMVPHIKDILESKSALILLLTCLEVAAGLHHNLVIAISEELLNEESTISFDFHDAKLTFTCSKWTIESLEEKCEICSKSQ